MPGQHPARWSRSSGKHAPEPATFDRVIRYVVVDPERIRNEWGDRWVAFIAYDMDRTAQQKVRAADH